MAVGRSAEVTRTRPTEGRTTSTKQRRSTLGCCAWRACSTTCPSSRPCTGRWSSSPGRADLLEITDELEARCRADDTDASTALVAGLDPDTTERIARLLTVHLHLTNLAEERQRARSLRREDGEFGGSADTGDIGPAVRGLRPGRPRADRADADPPGAHRAPHRGAPPGGRLGPAPDRRQPRRARRPGDRALGARPGPAADARGHRHPAAHVDPADHPAHPGRRGEDRAHRLPPVARARRAALPARRRGRARR